MTESYDVVVVGGGHAGCEAALASARIGARTALITMHRSLVGSMPCNPSIGGVAKSHLVFELDALGGEMPANTDCTGINFRVLNTARGPAVRSNRVQCDKHRYSRRILTVVQSQDRLNLIIGEVLQLIVRAGAVSGVILDDGRTVQSRSVVLTPGTALGGTIHIGSNSSPGGGNGGRAASQLAAGLKKFGFRVERLKTGTPARIAGSTIDYAKMEAQPGEIPAPFFSWRISRESELFHVEHAALRVDPSRTFHVEQSNPSLIPWVPGTNQMPCFLTRTTGKTNAIVRSNLSASSLYGGFITGTGARYCPSFEDKVVKFQDKDSHHVFVEPEGRDTDLIYPNGISNSLPVDIQNELVHSIPGLENADIIKYAFAIEYDFVDPTQLKQSLETKAVEGLFMAGQINGTTGYEEAAAQGFIAGVNAARMATGSKQIQTSRTNSYIGVMIDDLTTNGTCEPYRMFTSRSEYRLILRQDNARYRMEELARAIGIVDPDFLRETERFRSEIDTELARLRTTFSEGASLLQILRRPGVSYNNMPNRSTTLHRDVASQVEVSAKYEGYINHDLSQARKIWGMEAMAIPAGIEYWSLKHLRHEAKEKFSRIRPASVGQAARISGITPADIGVLLVELRRQTRLV